MKTFHIMSELFQWILPFSGSYNATVPTKFVLTQKVYERNNFPNSQRYNKHCRNCSSEIKPRKRERESERVHWKTQLFEKCHCALYCIQQILWPATFQVFEKGSSEISFLSLPSAILCLLSIIIWCPNFTMTPNMSCFSLDNNYSKGRFHFEVTIPVESKFVPQVS